MATTTSGTNLTTFDKIKAKMEKASKGSRVMVLSESDLSKEVVWMDTPTYDLNRILSGSLYKGVPSRTHTLVVGPEASGKSSYMCLNLASAQRQGFTPVIIDAEGAWTPEFVTRWGMDPTKIITIQTPWIDEIMVELSNLISEGYDKMAIAVDSIGALESYKMVEDGEKGEIKADQGGLQKKIKRMLKMVVAITKYQDSISFAAGHYYGNPSGYGDAEQIGGGKYPKLAADFIVTCKKTPLYEFPEAKKAADRGRTLGTRINAATIKNRYAPPFQEAVFEIDYRNGVNQMAGIIDVAMDMGLITGNTWYECPLIFDRKIQGWENLTKALKEVDPQPLLDEIEKVLKTQGYSSVNTSLELELGSEEDTTDTIAALDNAPDVEEEVTETPKKTKKKKGE